MAWDAGLDGAAEHWGGPAHGASTLHGFISGKLSSVSLSSSMNIGPEQMEVSLLSLS